VCVYVCVYVAVNHVEMWTTRLDVLRWKIKIEEEELKGRGWVGERRSYSTTRTNEFIFSLSKPAGLVEFLKGSEVSLDCCCWWWLTCGRRRLEIAPLRRRLIRMESIGAWLDCSMREKNQTKQKKSGGCWSDKKFSRGRTDGRENSGPISFGQLTK
jgi:hypothetical protein